MNIDGCDCGDLLRAGLPDVLPRQPFGMTGALFGLLHDWLTVSLSLSQQSPASA